MNADYDAYLSNELAKHESKYNVIEHCHECECELHECEDCYCIAGEYYCEDCIRSSRVTLDALENPFENY